MNERHVTRTTGRQALWGVALLGTVLALSACDKGDNKTAGEKLDAAVARSERAADDMKNKTQEMAADARAKMDSSTAGQDLKNAASNAGAAVSAAASDASITAAVNAGLAKDPDLSAIKINVDTTGGKVTLSGPAPNAAAKARAEQIAKSVQGVSAVDNQLNVSM